MEPQQQKRPILFVDVDGVISLFGFTPGEGQLPGPLHWIDGVAHCIPEDVGARLVTLAERFDLVWATGWEERANEHLPYILKLPFRDLPCLYFDGRAVFGSAHWKVDAIHEYARERPRSSDSALWEDKAPFVRMGFARQRNETPSDHERRLRQFASELASLATRMYDSMPSDIEAFVQGHTIPDA